MVGRDELPNAVALNASLFNASRVLGPAIAGVVIAAWGVGACFAINTVSFLAVLAGLLLMRESELFPVERDDEPPTVIAGIREGLAYAWRTPQMRLVLAIVTVVSTVGFNFHVILPLLASDTLAAGPGGVRPPLRRLRRRRARSARCSRPRSAARAGRCSCSAPAASASRCSRSHRSTTVWPCAVLLFVTGVASPSGRRTRTRSCSSARRITCAAASSASTSSPSPASRRSAACSPAGSSTSAARS